MTLIIGARCCDGVVLAADRRYLARYENGPDTIKLFKLDGGILLAGAGDTALLNESRIFIEKRLRDFKDQASSPTLFDIVEITSEVVNELVARYQGNIEEPFGFAVAGLENVSSGVAKIYTVFSAGLSELPWVCLGSGSSYARPIVELLLTKGALTVSEAAKVMAPLFTLVSNVQMTVGGGVDIASVIDEQGVTEILHRGEVSLESLREAMLDVIEKI